MNVAAPRLDRRTAPGREVPLPLLGPRAEKVFEATVLGGQRLDHIIGHGLDEGLHGLGAVFAVS